MTAYDPKLTAELLALSERSQMTQVLRLTAQLRAASAEIEKERASRLLADDTLLKCQNNAIALMYRVKELERALEQAAQIAEQQEFYTHADGGMVYLAPCVREQIAAKIRALAEETK